MYRGRTALPYGQLAHEDALPQHGGREQVRLLRCSPLRPGGGDTTDNRYKDPRTHCTRCGKLLPPARRRLCYECRPLKRQDKQPTIGEAENDECTLTPPAPPAPPKPRYTWQEQDARAEARGLTYGQLVNLENNGLPLPPLRRSVKWPWDSPHRGEEQI